MTRITVVASKLVHMLSFEWNDGSFKIAGAEFEGLVPIR